MGTQSEHLASNSSLEGATRREALGLMGGIIVLSQSSPVRAQGDTGKELIDAIIEVRRVEKAAFEAAISYPSNSLFSYLQSDFNARRKTLQLARASGAFSDVQSANSFIKRLPELVPAWDMERFPADSTVLQTKVVQALAEEKLALIPSPEVVVPAAIPELFPEVGDSDLQVLGDIVLEVLGIIAFKKSLAVELANHSSDLQLAIKNCLDAVSTKKWEDVGPTIEAVVKTMIAYIMASRAVLPDGAKRQFLFKLSVRCVPMVGWGYLVGCIMVSVWANHHRFSFAK